MGTVPKKTARENFSATDRHVIAARAGYRCSYPGCNKLTLGPALKSNEFEDTGYASHIYAASIKGPRGQGNLVPEQLSHPDNGIWMCGEHQALIDKKSGIRFPVHMLQSWKALHEHRTSNEHNGRQAPYGFIRQLKIDRSPLFVSGTQIDLAKTTFLVGGNGSGKTAICEWLTILGTSRNLGRWRKRQDLLYDITFEAPVNHRLQVKTGQELELKLDEKAVSYNYARASVVYLKNRGDRQIACDLRRIMELFGIEELELRSLVSKVSGQYVEKIEFVECEYHCNEDVANDAPNFELNCHLVSGETFSFGQLSGGERSRVLLDVAMALACEGTQFGPVLLIVELKSIGMDWEAISSYLTYFASANCVYQTIITSWELPTEIEMLGWQVYSVAGQSGAKGSVSGKLIAEVDQEAQTTSRN